MPTTVMAGPARQLFEAAAQHWINRENRDGDHESLGLLQWPTRHYFHRSLANDNP
jgi:hypothetical protein